MTRIVCLGEILLRLSPPGEEQFFQSPRLCSWFGGAELNVAVGLSRFGMQSAMVSRVPSHAIGDAAMDAVRKEGVDATHITRGGERLGAYFLEKGADLRPMRVVYDRAHSAFSEIAPDAMIWPEILQGASWFHLSGITPALGPGPARCASDAMQAARTLGIPVSLDLNYRAALWTGREPAHIVRPLAAACDLLIGNAPAVKAMLGIGLHNPHDDENATRALAARLHTEFGCGRVAITSRDLLSASEHGWSAALYVAREQSLHLSPRHQVQVVDRVGSGDAFTAGLICSLLKDYRPARALSFATAAGAFKLGVPGDFSNASVNDIERMLPPGE